MVPRELDSFLDVARRPSIDTDYRHIPLLTRESECGFEVATLDGPIGKGVRFEVGVFCGTGLIRTPDTVEPARTDISAVSGGRVVARCGRWYRMDERLRDFGSKSPEFGIRRPTIRSKGATAASGLLRRYRRQVKRNSEERGEETHDCPVYCIRAFIH